MYQQDFTMDLCLQPHPQPQSHPLCLLADHHYDMEVLSEINPDILVILICEANGSFKKSMYKKHVFSSGTRPALQIA